MTPVRALDRRGVLGGLSVPAERDLLALGRTRWFFREEPLPPALFTPDSGNALLIIWGLVKVTATVAGGRETFLSIRGAGDLLGEQGALRELRGDQYHPPRGTADLTVAGAALTDIETRVFPTGALRRYLKSHHDALAAVALGMWERLQEAESRIVSTGRDYSANQRLARLLCDLESYGSPQPRGQGTEAGTVLPIKISQAEFASWIGTSRETVERTLRCWRERHIVSTKYRTIVVHDLETLARIAGVQVRRRAWNWPATPDHAAEQDDAPAPDSPLGALGSGTGWG